MRLMENASRRAIGKAKKCNCTEPYLCSHNKVPSPCSSPTSRPAQTRPTQPSLRTPNAQVASYNTRRPTKTVVQYRRNGKRLRQSGRPEEGAAWEEKAADIDFEAQEEWRVHIASSIVASPWGANEAFVDQYAERHKKELDVLQKTHDVKRAVLNAETELKRRNFENTCDAEERKVKMQCRKQAAMRSRADAAEQAKEDAKLDALGEKSDGLKNVSANLMAMMNGGSGYDDGTTGPAIGASARRLVFCCVAASFIPPSSLRLTSLRSSAQIGRRRRRLAWTTRCASSTRTRRRSPPRCAFVVWVDPPGRRGMVSSPCTPFPGRG